MPPWVISVAIALGGLALFGACFAAAMLITRPARPRATAPTPDLGPETPALVNLLGNGWELNEDAVEATLLDLAARRHIELRQPGSDPKQTTVHLRDPGDAAPGELTPYEQRVLARVRGLAVDGVLPISALTFRDEDQEKGWDKRFKSEVLAEAHARGLSRRRFNTPVLALVEVGAALGAAGLGAAVAHWESWGNFGEDSRGIWVGVGFVAFLVFSGVAASVGGERHTADGLAVAGRWLGVRAWLHGHEEFAELPPASVMVWDRYLAYGAALGVTRVASDVLDLGMADRRRVWSSYGGHWHRVRVRYPRRGRHYGRPAGSLFSGALVRIAVGIGLLWLHAELLPHLEFRYLVNPEALDLSGVEPVARNVVFALAVYLIARGGYWLLRGIVDLATARTITGEVLWLEVWRKSEQENGPAVTTLHYLAVDDGSSDRTKAWALPPVLADDVSTGDTVTIRVRPWTRRVTTLQLVNRGSPHELAAKLAAERAADERAEAASIHGARPTPLADAGKLLTAAEVGRALGVSVRAQPLPANPVASMVTFTDERNRPLLMLQVTSGTPAKWIWRARSFRGHELSGLGDEARQVGQLVAARVGELTVLLALTPKGEPGLTALPELAQRALARLPRRQPTS